MSLPDSPKTPPASAPDATGLGKDSASRAGAAGLNQSLLEAQNALQRGDYQLAARRLQQVEQSGESAQQLEAKKLEAQLRPSGLSVYLFALTFLILLVTTVFAYLK